MIYCLIAFNVRSVTTLLLLKTSDIIMVTPFIVGLCGWLGSRISTRILLIEMIHFASAFSVSVHDSFNKKSNR